MRGKKFLAWLLTAALVLGLFPVPVLAAEPKTGLCPHHTEHTADCGYSAPDEGQPCGHVHDGACGFVEAAEEVPCDMGCTETDADGQIIHAEGCAYSPEVEGAPCRHEHDGACGYAPASPGQPCGYVCPICPVQAMIDALPAGESITANNRSDAEERLAAIDEARAGLTDEEAGQLDISRYQDAVAALSALDGQAGADTPMLAATEIDISTTDAIITQSGDYLITGTTGENQHKIKVSGNITATITLRNVTVTWDDCKDEAVQHGTASFSIEDGATVNLNLEGNNILQSGKREAGIAVQSGCILKIDGDGALRVTGGFGGAGIGGSSDQNYFGTINIEGGKITAKGNSSPAIGAAYRNTGGTINISGGVVKIEPYDDLAGIGGYKNNRGNDSVSATIDGDAVVYTNSIDHVSSLDLNRGILFTVDNSNNFTGKVYGNVELKENLTIDANTTLDIPSGATLTIPDGKTLTNNGTITGSGSILGSGSIEGSKLTPTVTAPTAKTGLTYTGSAQELVSAGSTNGGTMQYSTDNVTYSPEIPKATDAKNYTIYYKVVGNSYYNDVAAETVSVTIAQASNNITNLTCAGIVFGESPTPSATATFGTPTYSYSDSVSGTYGAWNTSNAKGTWYVKASVAGTDNYNAAEDTISFQVTAQREDTPSASIDYGEETLTGLTVGASYSITPVGGAAVAVTANNSGTIAIQEGWFGKTLSIVKTAQNDNYSDSESQNLTIPSRPAAPAAPLELTKTADSITVTNTGSYSGCEFSTDGTNWSDSGAFTGLTAGQTYPVSIRVKATNSAFASANQTVNVTTVNADGSTTVKPGESIVTGGGFTITNDGEKTTITGGGTTTTITPPSGGGNVDVGAGGAVTVPSGSTVQTGNNGPEITVGGQGGSVGGDGSITVPNGGSVTVKGSPDTTITPPSDGTVKPNPDGTVDVPGGSTVQTGDNGPEITVGGQGGSVGGDGSITVPNGGSVTVKGSPNTTITSPSGGIVKPNPNGTVDIPGGSTVQTGTGEPVVVPEGGGVFDPSTGEMMKNVHTVTVNGGKGSGSYAMGDTVTIEAIVPSGQRFTGWTVNAGGVTLANTSSATTTFTMPAQAVTVTASFENIPAPTFLVTVNGGRGSGSYAAGDTVTIEAIVPSGQRFTGWTVNAGGVTLANTSSATTTFIMPAQAVTVTANFQNNPSNNGNSGNSWYNPPATYSVTTPAATTNGKVTVSPANAARGSTVTITVIPEDGCRLDSLSVTSGGKSVPLTEKGNGKYTFTMPAGTVKVEAAFVPIEVPETPWINSFADIAEDTWYYDAVRFVNEQGLMNGYSDGRFGPNDTLSRAQLAQILFNREGRPGVNYLLQFGDVPGEAWYTEAVRWATSQGIVGGYGNGMFGPNDAITREQLAVMLWRYSGSPAATNKELHFADADESSDYALEALRWAVENGIINGYGNGQLAPQGMATRGQVAQMLMNFLKNR